MRISCIVIVDASLERFAVHEILDGGAEDPGGVDAVVVVEALVLDRDRGVGEVGGDLRPGDRRAQLVGLDEPEARAVGGEHLRGGAVDDRVARRRGPEWSRRPTIT